MLFEGILVAQLGEGEQIRIGARILMAQNPKLRVIFIPHGEALDDDSRHILAEIADRTISISGLRKSITRARWAW